MQTEKVIKRDNKYVLHTYARSQVVLAEGHGMTAADPEGKRLSGFHLRHRVTRWATVTPPGCGRLRPPPPCAHSNLYYTAPAATSQKAVPPHPVWMPFSLASSGGRGQPRAPSRPPQIFY